MTRDPTDVIYQLEAAAQDAHEAGWSIDRFRQRFWREIFRACNGRGKPDLGIFVERLKTILATGKSPEPAAVVGQIIDTQTAARLEPGIFPQVTQ